MFELKARPLPGGDGTPTRGGFLLGSTEDGYRQRLRDGLVWILEGDTLEGFAIVRLDAAFKASELGSNATRSTGMSTWARSKR